MSPGLAIGAAGTFAASAWLLVGSGTAAGRLSPRDRKPVGRRILVDARARAFAGMAGALAVALLSGPVPGAVAVAVGVVVMRRAAAARRGRLARAARVADLAALRALAAELSSGLSPPEALRIAAGSPPVAGLRASMLHAAAADASGGDAALALRGESAPGTAAGALAAAWAVCQRSGTSLAAPVKRIADGAAADLRVERETDAALASARASARLLAVLPFAGVLLGQLSGTGSVEVLLSTGLGQACLVGGMILDLAGLAWLDRLADAAGA